MRRLLPLFLIIFTACTPQTPASPLDGQDDGQILALYAPPETEAWIPSVYTCAAQTGFQLVARTSEIAAADVSLRIGAAENAYQIGEIELALVTNADAPIKYLADEEVERIVTGKFNNWVELGGEDAQITLWLYPANHDIQRTLNAALPELRKSSSLARQAQNSRELHEIITKNRHHVGVVALQDGGTELRILYSFGKFPVLIALNKNENPDLLRLAGCLQAE